MLKLIETPGIRKRIQVALDDIAKSASRDLREAAAEMPDRRPGGPHRFGNPGNAVWDRLPGKGYYFGLSRPYVYQLMREGLVKTALIKRPGKCRGIRLVWRPSVLEYIERHGVEGTLEPIVQCFHLSGISRVTVWAGREASISPSPPETTLISTVWPRAASSNR